MHDSRNRGNGPARARHPAAGDRCRAVILRGRRPGSRKIQQGVSYRPNRLDPRPIIFCPSSVPQAPRLPGWGRSRLRPFWQSFRAAIESAQPSKPRCRPGKFAKRRTHVRKCSGPWSLRAKALCRDRLRPSLQPLYHRADRGFVSDLLQGPWHHSFTVNNRQVAGCLVLR